MARQQSRGGGRLGSNHHHPGGKYNGGGGRAGGGGGGGGGTAASAASGRGKPNRPSDGLHNGEQPCCQGLALQCRQVLEAVQTRQQLVGGGGRGRGAEGTTGGSSSSSSSVLPTLPELVAAYLSETVASMRLDPSPSAASPAAYESGRREGANGEGGGGGPSDAAAAAAAAGKKKKSKKKKKKAKKAGSAAASTSASSVSATDEGGEEEGGGGDGGEGVSHQMEEEEEQEVDGDGDHDREGHRADGPRGEAAAAVSVASHATDEGMVAPNSDLPSYSTSEFNPPSPTLFDLMAQDYFAEAAAPAAKRKAAPPPPNGSKSSSSPKTMAGPTNRKAPQSFLPSAVDPSGAPAAAARSHEAFWDRLLVESKKFQVRKGAVASALEEIACPRCRKHVADVLEGTHQIRIHSSCDQSSHGGSPHPLSVSPPSPWDYHDPNDHRHRHRPSPMAYSDESYRQLEEGTLDDVAAHWFREQRHDLSFQFTVCHDDDEEMAWKLRGMGLDDDLIDDDDDVDNDGNYNDVDDDGGNDGVNGSHKKKRKSAKGKEPDVAAAKAALRSGGVEDWRKYVLYHYLLGRGVAADDLVRPAGAKVDNANETHNGAMADPDFRVDASINPGLVRNMASSARSTVSGYQATLNECAASLKAQDELLIQHDEQYLGGGELNMVVFPILKEADQMCCRTVSQQLRILSELSQWLFMSATAVRGEEAPLWLQTDLSNMQDTVLAMWELWLQATQVIVLEIAHYDSLTRKIATRNGQFVNPFSSSTYRKLYRDLVRTKLGAAKCLVEQMSDLLDTPLEVPGINPLDRKASVASKLVTSGIYCQHFWGFNYKQQPPPTQLDEDMRGVLDSIRECVETTHRGTWMEVQDEHENRRQQLSRRIDRVVTESNHLGCAGSVIRRLLLGSATTAQRSVEDDSSHTFEAELDPSIRYRDSLKEIGMQMVAGWVRERCHQRSNDEPTIPIMPAALSMRLVNGLQDVSCYFNAKTRAACILVSMFYRWMSDQCDAWRAELVAQELLTSIAEAEADRSPPGSDGATVSGTSKAGKKKKKKSNDGPSLRITPKLEVVDHFPPSSSDYVDRVGPSSAQSNVVKATGSDEVPCASSSPAPIEDASMIAEDVPEVHGNSTRWKHENELSTQNGHHLSVALKESVVQDDAARDFVLSNQDEVEAERMRLVDSVSALDAFVSIGVDCESAFESAEEFLVGRLMSILKPVA